MHVATGAAAGALVGSRAAALLLGPPLHLLADLVPHRDLASHRFEGVVGLAELAVLAVTRGALDPATLAALTASAPDLEHVLPLPRPGGRKLFPTHRYDGWHKAGGLSTSVQMVAAGALLGAVAAGWRGKRGGTLAA